MKENYSETVSKLAKWLDGGAIVVVGGRERSWIKDRIQAAFGASRVDWVEFHPKKAPETLEAVIARPDVAVVLLVIRSNIAVVRNVRKACALQGKVLVRAPGVTGIDRIAAEIMEQVGERLKERYEQRSKKGNTNG